MRNPLIKRLPRELRHDIGKYIALFLFLVATIGFVSGYLVADNSMTNAYDESFLKYNIEDGHFTLAVKADKALIDEIQKENVSVYELFYKDVTLKNENVVRIYKNRADIDKTCLMDGKMPQKNNEIVIDRLYAENNSIAIGDTITISDKSFMVSGTVALSDYSAMFKNNTDMMFNASRFTVAIVSDDAFDSVSESGLKYCYAWKNSDNSLTKQQRADKADDIKEILAQSGMLTDFVKQSDNQAITFTGEDMGSDKAMIITVLYVVIAIMAFVFGITTKSTIEQESGTIGTLRASGYTKGELLRHYLALPTLITLVAAIVGNVLGYTFMNKIVVNMYYHSYSLPTYETLWNANAFWMTTVIPCLIILVVNVLMIVRMLSLSPLKFLQHDLSHHKKKKAVKLPNWKFMTRFRTRVILQNKGAYLTLFVGIFLASLMLIFGMVMDPILSHFKTEVLDSKISDYQYILKMPAETENKDAEKYCTASLNLPNSGEEITIYGISADSDYIKNIDLPFGNNEILISSGYAEKYDVKVGDTITLEKEYENKSYTFKVKGTYHYAASLSVFMTRDTFNNAFDKDENYFNGYFSDEKLTDIDDMAVATIITKDDLTAISDQLDDSMGAMFPMVSGFAAVIYILLMYLLSKLIVEKNAQSVSMLKILGYSDKEAGRLYNRSTAIVVGLSLILTLPLDALAMHALYNYFMNEINGWITYYIAPWIYPSMVVIGIVCYLFVSMLQSRRIKKIPMSQALKNME